MVQFRARTARSTCEPQLPLFARASDFACVLPAAPHIVGVVAVRGFRNCPGRSDWRRVARVPVVRQLRPILKCDLCKRSQSKIGRSCGLLGFETLVCRVCRCAPLRAAASGAAPGRSRPKHILLLCATWAGETAKLRRCDMDELKSLDN